MRVLKILLRCITGFCLIPLNKPDFFGELPKVRLLAALVKMVLFTIWVFLIKLRSIVLCCVALLKSRQHWIHFCTEILFPNNTRLHNIQNLKIIQRLNYIIKHRLRLDGWASEIVLAACRTSIMHTSLVSSYTLVEASMNGMPYCLANSSPCGVVTFRSEVRSDFVPQSTKQDSVTFFPSSLAVFFTLRMSLIVSSAAVKLSRSVVE